MKPLVLALALVAVPAAAHADDRWDATAGVSLSRTHVDGDGMPGSTSGSGGGLTVSGAYTPGRLGFVVDAWVIRAGLGECYQDAACFNYLGSSQQMITAGPRLQHASFHAQLTAGAALSLDDFGDGTDLWFSRAFGAAAGWRHTDGDWQLGIEARASVFTNDSDSQVTNLGVAATFGQRW
jgi:hypothetical protein